jgi:hypothetical protein
LAPHHRGASRVGPAVSAKATAAPFAGRLRFEKRSWFLMLPGRAVWRRSRTVDPIAGVGGPVALGLAMRSNRAARSEISEALARLLQHS